MRREVHQLQRPDKPSFAQARRKKFYHKDTKDTKKVIWREAQPLLFVLFVSLW
jgi:hypothetical protein